MIELQVPISVEEIRKLKVGDVVSLNGVIVTARDAAHKYMIEKWIKNEPTGEDAALKEKIGALLNNGVIYHCGPVVKQDEDGTWHFVAAGPTTSIREEPYEHIIIDKLNVRAIIGKGGMADKTLEACQKHGAVYLHAVGGAASLIAQRVEKVLDVDKLDLGKPEAFWQIQVSDFQCVVTMDSHGNSLHKEILAKSKKRYEELINN